MKRGKQNVIDSKSQKRVPAVSRRRLWLFRAAAVIVVPLLLLVFTEGILRIADAGYRTETAVRFELNGQPYYGHNFQFGWRFFPPRIARDFNGFAFETKKKPGTYRIFVLGESAAMGVPEPAYSFGRILETMLQDMFPDRHFEVVNVAIVAINSHAVRYIAKDCSRYEPDLFVIYMGNNEVVGPFGPGTVFSPIVSNLTLIRANIALKATRIGQLLARAGSIVPTDKRTQRWAGLEMFLDHPVRSDDPAMATVYGHFEQNLRDICDITRQSGAKVLVSTVGCNLKDCPPFGSRHRSGLTEVEVRTWEEFYHEGTLAESAGQFTTACEKYRAAAAIDETYAELQFRMARCFDETGAHEEARTCYRQAMQYDVLRLRADEQINQIIHSVAEARGPQGITLVDGAGALEQSSPDGICGEELFYEHVHLTFKGNYVLAKTIASELQASNIFSGTDSRAVLSEEECARRLVYMDFERWENLSLLYTKMLSEPPFTNQLYHAETMARLSGELARLNIAMEQQLSDTAQLYETALSEKPDDWLLHWRYAVFLKKGTKDTAGQEQHLKQVLPYRYVPAYLQLGQLLGAQGRFNEARTALNQMLELKPNAAQAHVELARLYQLRRDNAAYIEHMAKSISMAPAVAVEPYGALAAAYEQAGKPEKAIEVLQRAVEIFPEEKTAQVHATLGYMYCNQRRFDKANKELQLALKINPGFAEDAMFQNLLKKVASSRAR